MLVCADDEGHQWLYNRDTRKYINAYYWKKFTAEVGNGRESEEFRVPPEELKIERHDEVIRKGAIKKLLEIEPGEEITL